MDIMKWLCLTENNEWENETWNFYFPMTENNIKAFNEINRIIEENELEEEFRTKEMVDYSSEQLKDLPGRDGYLRAHNVFIAELDVEKLSQIKEYDNEFYKGQIRSYRKE